LAHRNFGFPASPCSRAARRETALIIGILACTIGIIAVVLIPIATGACG
jgi:hypothetical protein